MAPKGEHKSTRQAKLAYFWQNTQHARIQITATNPHYHHCCITGEINITARHRHPKFNLKKYSTLAFRQWLLTRGGLSRHGEEAQHPWVLCVFPSSFQILEKKRPTSDKPEWSLTEWIKLSSLGGKKKKVWSERWNEVDQFVLSMSTLLTVTHHWNAVLRTKWHHLHTLCKSQ